MPLFLLSICLLFTCTNAEDLKVFGFQTDGIPSTESYALLEDEMPVLRPAVTYCYRLKVLFFRTEFVPFTYDQLHNEHRIDHLFAGLRFGVKDYWVMTSKKTPQFLWTHVCVAYQYEDGRYKIVVDGEEVTSGFKKTHEPFGRGNGTFMLGQAQDRWNGLVGAKSFSGYITDMQWYKRFLSDEEMKTYTSCTRPSMPGDVINWKTANWKINDVEVSTTTLNAICKESYEPFVIFPELRTFNKSFEMCFTYGGGMATPESHEDNDRLFEISNPFLPYCRDPLGDNLGWVGLTDMFVEDTWEHMNQHMNGSFQEMMYPGSWKDQEPNGGDYENCVIMKGGDSLGVWNDEACHDRFKHCTACQFEKPPKMTLRGLCEKTDFDKHFTMFDYRNDKPEFQGAFESSIYWDNSDFDLATGEGDAFWKMAAFTTNYSHAKMITTDPNKYPLGKNNWFITKDKCAQRSNHEVILTLTVCQRGQFTCDDGNCVPMAARCNRRKDCPDSSDEADCRTVILPEGYRKALPPPNEDAKESLPIKLSVAIISFVAINTLEMEFKVDFMLNMTWFDLRLTLHNLKERTTLNTLPIDEMNEVWAPQATFENAQGNQHTLVDGETRMMLERQGELTEAGLDSFREIYMFQGNENPIVITRKYTVAFGCSFELQFYPFDTQTCSMDFRVDHNTKDFIKLITGDLNNGTGIQYLGPTQLIEYTVQNFEMIESDNDSPFSGKKIKIVLRRKFGNQLLNTYLPTFCLLIIIYTTHFYKFSYYDLRVMVALTGMLVMTSLFVTVSASLPKTSYLKMIDIWMIFCQILPFGEIVLHTIVEYMVSGEPGPDYKMKRRKAGKSIRVTPLNKSSPVTAFSSNDDDEDHHDESQLWKLLSPIFPKLLDEKDPNAYAVDYLSRFLVPAIFTLFCIVYWSSVYDHVKAAGNDFWDFDVASE